MIFGHLNIISITKKIDFSCQQFKGVIDVLMISETKLDDNFAEGQFLMEGYHENLIETFDKNKIGGCILLYIREDIPAKLLLSDFPVIESFYIEINLQKKMAS